MRDDKLRTYLNGRATNRSFLKALYCHCLCRLEERHCRFEVQTMYEPAAIGTFLLVFFTDSGHTEQRFSAWVLVMVVVRVQG